jgi:prepilin-type N-terminal cleavage/methylation domain-containing protein
MVRHMRPAATGSALLRRVRAEDGFTLFELLVTMVILLVVVGGLTEALVSAMHNQSDLNLRFQSQTQARQALVKLTREIHCANQIQDANGAALTSTKVSGITVTLPAGCPTGGAAAVTVRWCTVANGSRYDLYRYANGGCGSAGGVRWATSLSSSTPFSLPTTSTAGSHYPMVHVELKVAAGKSTTTDSYDLIDDIAAFNSARSATG